MDRERIASWAAFGVSLCFGVSACSSGGSGGGFAGADSGSGGVSQGGSSNGGTSGNSGGEGGGSGNGGSFGGASGEGGTSSTGGAGNWTCGIIPNESNACYCDDVYDNGDVEQCGSEYSCCILGLSDEGSFCECSHDDPSECASLAGQFPEWQVTTHCPP